MFKPFTRSRPRPRPQRVRPDLESLEHRDCPSLFGAQPSQELWYLLNTSSGAGSGTGSTVTHNGLILTGGGGGGSGGGSQGNSGPTIDGLNVTYNGKANVTLSGTVTDPNGVADLIVSFTGQVSGIAVTNANGSFTLTTNASGVGVVNAVVVDNRGDSSPVATVTLSATGPTITNFAAVEGYDQIFTFTGDVTDQPPGGLPVTFGGVPSMAGQTTTTNADGSFELVVQLNANGSDNGTVWAQTTDWWGLTSQQATTSVFVTT
jgi:hypothetical protein